jgi:ABC-type nitrate/sulfonate/bicarbonate transport system ATPase subunit
MIEIHGLAHRFGDVDALAGIDLEIAAGETMALVGPSGCGKSTLLELIGGLTAQGEGEITISGRAAAAERSQSSAWMPQSDMLMPWKTAADNAAIALRLAGDDRASARSEATRMLDRLGLSEFAKSYPRQMSGGMRQRVAFARTLLAGTPVLLLDEPFAALDAITRADLQGWLIETLRVEGRTTVLVTHDVEEALFVADRVALLSPRPGRVILTIDSPAQSERSLPRAQAISRPAFVAARERALEALEESKGASPG